MAEKLLISQKKTRHAKTLVELFFLKGFRNLPVLAIFLLGAQLSNGQKHSTQEFGKISVLCNFYIKHLTSVTFKKIRKKCLRFAIIDEHTSFHLMSAYLFFNKVKLYCMTFLTYVYRIRCLFPNFWLKQFPFKNFPTLDQRFFFLQYCRKIPTRFWKQEMFFSWNWMFFPILLKLNFFPAILRGSKKTLRPRQYSSHFMLFFLTCCSVTKWMHRSSINFMVSGMTLSSLTNLDWGTKANGPPFAKKCVIANWE